MPSPPFVLGRLLSSGRGHLRPLMLGALFTLPAVGLHLALPLLLHGWIRVLKGRSDLSASLPHSPLAFSAALLATLFGLGLAEHFQRLSLARFAIRWSRALRARTLAAVTSHRPPDRISSAELVSILVADMARLKAGIKVFLPYVASNLLLLSGAAAVIAFTDRALGGIFAIALLLTVVVAAIGARGSYVGYLQFRGMEGLLAQAIEESGSDDYRRVGATSSASEYREARINALTTLATHLIMGLAVLACLVTGSARMAAGHLDPEAMLVFVGYVFLLTKPMVRLARHGARSGKILACAARLVWVQEACRLPARVLEWGVVELERIDGRPGGPILRVPPGGRLLVVGPPASGKSSLLRAVMGMSGDWNTEARIAGVSSREVLRSSLERVAGLLEQEVSWERARLLDLLPGASQSAAVVETLDRLGAGWMHGLPEGLDSMIGSGDLSHDQARTFKLAVLLASDRRVLLLDDPPPVRWMEEMKASRDRTWIVASSSPLELGAFDQVLHLEGGSVCFLGKADQWVESCGERDPWRPLPR